MPINDEFLLKPKQCIAFWWFFSICFCFILLCSGWKSLPIQCCIEMPNSILFLSSCVPSLIFPLICRLFLSAVVIVIVFTFCWSPFHAQRLLFLYVTLYSSWNLVLRQINGVLFLSAGQYLFYLNFTITLTLSLSHLCFFGAHHGSGSFLGLYLFTVSRWINFWLHCRLYKQQQKRPTFRSHTPFFYLFSYPFSSGWGNVNSMHAVHIQ